MINACSSFVPTGSGCTRRGSSERCWNGAFHDRDINAAININREGLRLLQERGFTIINHRTVGTMGIHAREDRVRPATVQALVVEPGIPRL